MNHNLIPSQQGEQEITGRINVRNAIDCFNDHTTSPADAPQVSDRTDIVEVLQLFDGGRLTQVDYDVARLADIADRLNNDIWTVNAKRALQAGLSTDDLRGTPSPEYKHLTDTISDFSKVNDHISAHLDNRSALVQHDEALYQALNQRDNAPIPAEIWLGAAVQPDLRSLAELAVTTNIEVLLTKSVQALLRLKSDFTNDTEQLRVIAAVEAVYAPILEIIGLDALAATMLDAVNQTRLKKGGREDLVEQAEAIMNSLGPRQSIEEFTEILPHLFGGDALTDTIIDSSSGHEAFFGYGVMRIEEHDVDIVSRIKTVGSIARKLQYSEAKGHSHAEMPVDIVAATLICKDTNAVAEVFTHTLTTIARHSDFEYANAPSRTEPLHVKGKGQFQEAVIQALRRAGIDEPIDVVDNENGFEVAKVTCMLPIDDSEGAPHVPIELQFVHQEARKQSRVGQDSHTIFKLLKYSTASEENMQFLRSQEAVDCINDIYRRRKHMDSSTLESNPCSVPRGKELRKQIATVTIPPNGWLRAAGIRSVRQR